MRVAPLDINRSFNNRYKKPLEAFKKQEVVIELQEIPDDVVIRYEKWPDGFFYPQTAGQFRIQQKGYADAFMVLAKEHATI